MRPVQSHYSVLGVRRDASPSEIRAAYLAQLKAHHPDLSRDPTRAARIIRLQSAYACLRDPERRAAHDRDAIAAELSSRRKVRRAWRRLKKLDRRAPPRLAVRLWWIAAMGVVTTTSLLAGVLYLTDS